MKNAINNQFKMNPGSKEVDTEGTFKNDAAVLNMGHPTNYGTPMKKTDPDKEETREEKGKRVYEAAMARARAQKAASEAKKKAPKKKSLLPKIKMGMGTGYTTVND
tara:strand:+ start:1962 stop:2279 length:318 start_codon:yes stop_codon:yes gene_type:complete